MKYVICPKCKETLLKSTDLSYTCKNAHAFNIIDGILDLLPTTSDKNIIEEQEHWDSICKRGRNTISPNRFIKAKMVNDLRKNCEEIIIYHLNNKVFNGNKKTISIGEIGCGTGSATTYFGTLQVSEIEYYGSDVSLERLVRGLKVNRPYNWQINFIRSSANTQLFANESVDIIFSAAALHHLDLAVALNWISKSLKKGGLLILYEPSLKNPFAMVGRKMIRGFYTSGEKPLNPSEVRRLAEINGLRMVYQKGEHFLTGPVDYLLGMWNLPAVLIKLAYHTTRRVDSLVRSPSINYTFIQAFKK